MTGAIETIPYSSEVAALLEGAGLPTADLRDDRRIDWSGLRVGARLEGVVGLEVHGSEALLRSLVVASASRSRGLGRALVAHAEKRALQSGVVAVYLLTDSAAAFFAGLGYRALSRSEAPPLIAATTQFSGLCPASAVFMANMLEVGASVPSGQVAAR